MMVNAQVIEEWGRQLVLLWLDGDCHRESDGQYSTGEEYSHGIVHSFETIHYHVRKLPLPSATNLTKSGAGLKSGSQPVSYRGSVEFGNRKTCTWISSARSFAPWMAMTFRPARRALVESAL